MERSDPRRTNVSRWRFPEKVLRAVEKVESALKAVHATYKIIAFFIVTVATSFGWWEYRQPAPETYSQTELADVAQQFRYELLSPPTNLHGPGSFATVEYLSDGKVKLHSTCRMDPVELAERWRQSPTTITTFKTEVSRSREAGFESSPPDPPSITFLDPRVLTISDEDLLELRARYIRDNCEKAIVYNIRAGADVCQVNEVLEGIVGGQTVQPGNLTEWFLGLLGKWDGERLFLGVKLSPRCLIIRNTKPKPAAA